MKISCSTTGVLDGPLMRTLPQIRQAGGKAVEMSWTRVQADFPDAPDRVSQVRQLLQDNGLVLSGLVVTDLAVEDNQDWGPTVTLIQEQMTCAGLLNVSSVNVYAGIRERQSLEMLASGLDQVLSVACELGLTVNLANCCGTRIEQIEDLRHIFATAAHPALRMLNDVGHFLASAVNPRDVLAEFQYKTACVHLSDRVGKRPVPIGHGKVNLPAILNDLKQMHYNGWLVVDLEVGDTRDASQLLTNAFTYVEQLLETANESE